MSGGGAGTGGGAATAADRSVAGPRGEGRAASVAWLVAGMLVVSQILSSMQISALRARVVQIEAGVEFWEYGQGSCSAPAGGTRTPAADGFAALLPEGAV